MSTSDKYTVHCNESKLPTTEHFNVLKISKHQQNKNKSQPTNLVFKWKTNFENELSVAHNNMIQRIKEKCNIMSIIDPNISITTLYGY